MKKLVIFDLDGTLLNTVADLGTAVNHALVLNGFHKHVLHQYIGYVGNGVRKLVERSLPDEFAGSEMVDKVLADFKEYYSEHCCEKTMPYSTVNELLYELKDMDVSMAVASNKYQEATSRIIKHYFPDINFVAVEGQKTNFPIKPDPSIVFSILSQTGTPKADTLYVGDSGVDMTTARRACVDSVGVTWGFRPESEIRENMATFIATEPSQILDIVRGINLANYINR